MYKRSPVSWSKHVDFMFFDLIYVQAAFIFAYFLRQGSVNVYQDSIYRIMAVVIGMMHICVSVFTYSYKDILRRGYMVEFFATVKHVLWIVAGEVFFLFFTKSGSAFSRLNTVYFGVSAVFILYVWHCIWKKVLLRHMKSGEQRHLLLVADKKKAEHLLDEMSKNVLQDYSLQGIVLLDGEAAEEREIRGVPVTADLNTAENYLTSHVIDEVLFAQRNGEMLPQELIKKCEMMGLAVHIEIPESEVLPTAAAIEQISGINVFSSYVKLVTRRQMLFKRLMDLCGSVVGLLITGVLSVFVVPAIYFSDPGPVIFAQQRVGKNGRTFRLYKFRSMYQDAEARKKELAEQNQISGPMFKIKADPRIIGSGKDGSKKGLGWFLRTTSIDELPQFWNVLKGDMSLVGTRPPTLDEWEQYELHHRARMTIKPGITGMWQVSGRSEIHDFDEVVRLDTEYIRNWSPALDIKLLVKTVLVVLMKKGSC